MPAAWCTPGRWRAASIRRRADRAGWHRGIAARAVRGLPGHRPACVCRTAPGPAGARVSATATHRPPCGLFRDRTGEASERLRILRCRLLDDLRGQPRARRALVPVQRFQVITHDLLVETGRTDAHPVLVSGPEAGRIRRKHFVDEYQLAIWRQAELELRVSDDDAAPRGMRGGEVVQRERRIAHQYRQIVTDATGRLIEGDVLVVIAHRGFGGRGEN